MGEPKEDPGVARLDRQRSRRFKLEGALAECAAAVRRAAIAQEAANRAYEAVIEVALGE